MKGTGINLQTLQDKYMSLLLEKNIRGGVSSVMGDRYVRSDESRKILYVDAKNLYGWVMSEYVPYNKINFDRDVKLKDISKTPDDSGIGYFIEVDMKYPDNTKYETRIFPFASENRKN